MSTRLTSAMLVGALVRQAQAQGGSAMILHKGEAMSGTILVQLLDRGTNMGFFERVATLNGTYELAPCGPRDLNQDIEMSDYIARRISVDPDMWVVELDTAAGQQLAAQLLCAG